MRRLGLLAAGLACLVAGLVFLPLPTPVGLPLLVVGMALLLTVSKWLRRRVRQLRDNHDQVDRKIRWIEPKLPGFISRALRLTRPFRSRVTRRRTEVRRPASGTHGR